jgi:hypothetical protein
MRPLAVFDIDGVLADVSHRVHFLEQRRKDWGAFFRAAVDDDVLPEGSALVHEAAKECEVAYLTGRPEVCRRDTREWLRVQGFPVGTLAMRPNRDHRPAREAKPPMLARLAAGRVLVIVVDDDLEVCDAYEAAGWTVMRALWASRSPALEVAQEAEGRT